MSVFTILLFLNAAFILSLTSAAPNQRANDAHQPPPFDPLRPRQISPHPRDTSLPIGTGNFPAGLSPSNGVLTSLAPLSTAYSTGFGTAGSSYSSGNSAIVLCPTQGAPYQNSTSAAAQQSALATEASYNGDTASQSSFALGSSPSDISAQCPAPQTVILPAQTVTLPAQTVTVTPAPETTTVTVTVEALTQTITVSVTITAVPTSALPTAFNEGSLGVLPGAGAPSNVPTKAPFAGALTEIPAAINAGSDNEGAGSKGGGEAAGQVLAQTRVPAQGPVQLTAPSVPAETTTITEDQIVTSVAPASAVNTLPAPNESLSAQGGVNNNSPGSPASPSSIINQVPGESPSLPPPAPYPFQNSTSSIHIAGPIGSDTKGSVLRAGPTGSRLIQPSNGPLIPSGVFPPSLGASGQGSLPPALSGLQPPPSSAPSAKSPSLSFNLGPVHPFTGLPPIPTLPAAPPANETAQQAPPLSPYSTAGGCGRDGTSTQNLTATFTTLHPFQTPLLYLGLNYTSFTLDPSSKQLHAPAGADPKMITIAQPFRSFALSSLTLGCLPPSLPLPPTDPHSQNCSISLSALSAPGDTGTEIGGAGANAKAMVRTVVVAGGGGMQEVNMDVGTWNGLGNVRFGGVSGGTEVGIAVEAVGYEVLSEC